jgi:hypothetical protein
LLVSVCARVRVLVHLVHAWVRACMRACVCMGACGLHVCAWVHAGMLCVAT